MESRSQRRPDIASAMADVRPKGGHSPNSRLKTKHSGLASRGVTQRLGERTTSTSCKQARLRLSSSALSSIGVGSTQLPSDDSSVLCALGCVEAPPWLNMSARELVAFPKQEVHVALEYV